MRIDETDVRELVDRVERLERQNRCWKLGGLLVVLTFAFSLGMSVMAQQKVQSTPFRVEAQDFQLRDAAGNLMGELALKNNKPVLELYDASGKVTWSTNVRVSGLNGF